MRFQHLAQRLFNTPLAIRPEKAEVIMAALSDRLGVSHLFRVNGDAVAVSPQAFFDSDDSDGPRRSRERDAGYDVVAGVAVIHIEGTLVHKLGALRPWSGMTGYDGIRTAFLGALRDPEVRAIVLLIDSPGGEVAGCFDLVDTIHGARGDKPIWSILSEGAYSAAYALASAADRVIAPRTGGAGSIGVIWMHVDWSTALTGAGIKVTFVTYGDRKADGHPEIPLSKEARERFQADIDTMGALFVDTVARNRGLPAAKVRDTQAATFLAADAERLGLVDAVMAPDAAFLALLDQLG
ncbi:S49 family peptidase [Azospirillum cavernae]|uniref:S49 family peptidase n=2 Tax=Azospirillum cavernae TaxID=2320860 RepID=A0A418VZ91_9PROT|nr:S49 family peptidase [Azospirillum cavernae]